MKRKRKMLGIVLFAALAMSALLVANAGATRSGHFTSDTTTANTTTIVGHESMNFPNEPAGAVGHKVEFASASLAGISEPIYCTNATFHGTLTALTVEEIKITPTYSECKTTKEGKPGGAAVTVNFNGCQYKFTSRSEPGDATAGLVCPVGKVVELTAAHSGCVLRFAPQTIANAVTYDTVVENNKHAITLRVTAAGIAYTAHGGLCVFIATNQGDWGMTGSVTVTGRDLNGNFVNITAT